MGQASITEIAAEIENWDLLQKLPKQIGDFILCPGSGIKGQILNIAAYVNEKTHCRLDLTYTSETFDYVPVKTVGLHTFRDERYFARDREHFAKMLLQHLDDIIKSIDRKEVHKFDYEAEALHFEQWDYWRSLPQLLEGYELFITPENPLAYINGSFIFLDYTDFENGNQVYFSYNIFRNEIFAEMKKDNLPLTTDAYDVGCNVADDKKLELLTTLLQNNLQKTLEKLKKD